MRPKRTLIARTGSFSIKWRYNASMMAVAAYQAIDASGLSRVDFFLQQDGELLVNEINTLPGLTDVSGFPKMWEASGLPFAQVIDQLIAFAIERHRERARNETSI